MYVSKIATLVASALLVLSCDSSPDEQLDGQITIALSAAPTDAACLKITAVGNRSVTKEFDLATGQDTQLLKMTGIATGPNEFSGAAYNTACKLIRPSDEPVWIADPVGATVATDGSSSVKLVFKRNGRITVNADFQEDPANLPPNTASCQPGVTPLACTCLTGFGNCDGIMTMTNGCELNTSFDSNNCGACGVTCTDGKRCKAGVCE